MNAQRFLLSLAISLLVGLALLCVWFVAHLWMPWWPHHLNREVRIAKHHIAHSVEGPTLWLQGGSSAWFGFDSELIRKETGYDVVNLAFNVNMPSEYCFDEVRRFAKPGDAVILGLENSMYFRDYYSSYAVDEITIWDPDFFWSLSLPRKAKFLKSLPWRKILASSIVRVGTLTGHYERSLKPLSADQVIQNLHAQWEGAYEGKIPAYYNYLTLNRHGDFVHTNHALWRGEHNYNLMKDSPISEMTRTDFSEFSSWTSQNNISVFMSWIPMARNPKLDLNRPEARSTIQRIADFAHSFGFEFLGSPEEFVLDIELFYDTSHHTNAEGARIRTERLLPHLLERLPSKD